MASEFEPRERAGGNAGGALGAPIFGREKDGVGKYFLLPDADGDLWDLDWPMLMVDYPSAVGYAEWLSKNRSKWRTYLLDGMGKGSKGTDRRIYPWGNHLITLG